MHTVCAPTAMEENDSSTIEIDARRAIHSVLFIKDGKEILSGGDAGKIQRWRADSGHEVDEAIQAGADILAIALSPDRKWLVGGVGWMSNVRVWDAETHTEALNINGHVDAVWSVDISSDSSKFATGGVDRRVFTWGMTTGEQLIGPLMHDGWVLAVRFSPNGDRLATATAEKSLRIFRSDDGQQLLNILCSFKRWLSSPIAWSADGRKLFAVTSGGVKCFDAFSGSSLGSWTTPGDALDFPSSIALSCNQKFVAVAAATSLSFWDACTHVQIGSAIEHDSYLRSAALSPTNDCVVTGEKNGKITLRTLRDVLPASYLQTDFITFDDDASDTTYDDSISDNAALSPDPHDGVDLLVEQTKALLLQRKLRSSVLDYGDEVIDLSCPHLWDYEAKHAALVGLKQHGITVDTRIRNAFPVMEKSVVEETRRHLPGYNSPVQTELAIHKMIHDILPIVLIDVKTGVLCDVRERMRIFKSTEIFRELVSSVPREIDEARIQREVATFFQYVTLSHVWQGEEPSFQVVILAKSIHNLDASGLNNKLRRFCDAVDKEGYRWAWSDTCCIDKTISTVLNESITLMYKWYEESAATFIYLEDVIFPPSTIIALAKTRWMSRAWTLQELLAPKVVRFYDRDWNPYFNIDDRSTNHKGCDIMVELARTIDLPLMTITEFHPDNLGVREKLRLASTREATREEDIAYSLLGIFRSDIKPNYGDRGKALGQLLEEIVTRSGEVTVLDWTGKSSPFNTCLPTTLAVYSRSPHVPPTIEDAEMNVQVSILRNSLCPTDTILINNIHDQITRLPPARFTNRRLYLPCVIFAVQKLVVKRTKSQEKCYCARVSVIGHVVFQTSDTLLPIEADRLVLVHPWIRYLCDPYKQYPWRGASRLHEPEYDSSIESDSDSEGSAYASPSDTVPTTVDGQSQALRLMVRLQQPFHALLFQHQPTGEFRRVASDHQIIVPGFDPSRIEFIKDVRTEVLEIL